MAYDEVIRGLDDLVTGFTWTTSIYTFLFDYRYDFELTGEEGALSPQYKLALAIMGCMATDSRDIAERRRRGDLIL